MSRINPDDVFPARNLPGEAEKWGRSVEEEVKKLREQQEITNQLLSGQNRGSASSLANIGDQIGDINAILGRLITTTPISGATLGTFGVSAIPTYSDVASTAILTPVGYTKSLVSFSGFASAKNTSGALGYLYVACAVNAVKLADSFTTAEIGKWSTVGAAAAKVITGLSGGDSIAVSVQASASVAWSLEAANRAFVQGFALFYN